MTLRPIDMQTMLPKVPEVSRTQQIQNNQEQHQAQQFATEMNKQAKQAENQVQNSKETEGKSVSRDKGKPSSGREQSPNEEHQEKEQAPELILPPDPNKGTRLDIKV
ncbi:MAG TPA: hypothetical protein VHS59_13020 [Bacillota bacterium]|nr:hypothetical protein [Bacillota bacterium]